MFLLFFLKKVFYFLVYLFLNGCNKLVEVVEIFLSKFSFMKVDIVNKVLGGFGEDLI